MQSFQITIDAASPSRLARFWAAALPGYQVRPYDEAEITRLASLGLTPETDTSVPIDAQGQPTIWFQKSDRVTTVRNRIHLDLSNGEQLASMLSRGSAKLIQPNEPVEDIIKRTFSRAIGREPTEDELRLSRELIGDSTKPDGVSDYLWALLMLPEFQLIR